MRKYSYALGRFTSIDPLWEEYYEWSPYQYSINNPVMFEDGNGSQLIPVLLSSRTIQLEPVMQMARVVIENAPKVIQTVKPSTFIKPMPPVPITNETALNPQFAETRQDNVTVDVTVEPPTMEMSKRNKQEKDKSQKKSKAKDSGKNEPHKGDGTKKRLTHEIDEAKKKLEKLKNLGRTLTKEETKLKRKLIRKIDRLQKERGKGGPDDWNNSGERGNRTKNGNRPTIGG